MSRKRYREDQSDSDQDSSNGPKRSHPGRLSRRQAQPDQDTDIDDLWVNKSFFAVDSQASGIQVFSNAGHQILQAFPFPDQGREMWERDVASHKSASNHDTTQLMMTDFLFPSLPSKARQEIESGLCNPFSSDAVCRHQGLRINVVGASEVEVNGYIKFRIQPTSAGFDSSSKHPDLFRRPSHAGQNGHHLYLDENYGRPSVPMLPPNFGRGARLNASDQKIFTFYTTAYCQGRTVLPHHNYWLTEITPMAESEPIVRHALLAFAGSYILDYVQSDSLRNRVNKHYSQASQLIGLELSQYQSHTFHDSAPLIAAISLLQGDDEVFWEFRRPKTEIPTFFRAILLAKAILDQSDPGYRYWKPENVQRTPAWVGMSTTVAFGGIVLEMVSPLMPFRSSDRNYAWLLWGTRKEAHTIEEIGLSPKLLHIFAQITRLCAQLRETPDSIMIPLGATRILKNLESFRQRSDLSEGHATAADLLASCTLDTTGRVNSAIEATELGGECWLCAAKIYLHCRFFRKPLWHPDVRANLRTLIQCFQRLPQDGPLLTAQSPFFPIFMMGLVSCETSERKLAREWFENVIALGGRSSVPPVWKGLQLAWSWLDRTMLGHRTSDFDEDLPISIRVAWWEDMVEFIITEIGWMSLT